MENQNNLGVQDSLAKGMQLISDISTTNLKMMTENSTKAVDVINNLMSDVGLSKFKIPNILGGNSKSDCCVPKNECPPHCILQIERHAYQGETIVVPFNIKNTCSKQKTYKVGVRELKNVNGTLAPSKPQLNKTIITLENGETEQVLMKINLEKFETGANYKVEIVIREKEINQNICFSLIIDGTNNAPTAKPLDEKQYLMKWHSWKDHFYCETRLGN